MQITSLFRSGVFAVPLDFSPVTNGEIKLLEFSQRFTRDDLRAFTHESLDTMLDIMKDLTDAQMIFLPDDPDANDQFAPPEEQHIGWSVAHASAEEWASYSSILARGIVYPAEPRLRIETDWHTVKTKAEVLQRIGESRRMRLAYLDTWPDAPKLDVFRELSERFLERNGKINAAAAFLFGLRHEYGHHEQMREAARQARAASAAAQF
jgi:hypothetical protein